MKYYKLEDKFSCHYYRINGDFVEYFILDFDGNEFQWKTQALAKTFGISMEKNESLIEISEEQFLIETKL